MGSYSKRSRVTYELELKFVPMVVSRPHIERVHVHQEFLEGTHLNVRGLFGL